MISLMGVMQVFRQLTLASKYRRAKQRGYRTFPCPVHPRKAGDGEVVASAKKCMYSSQVTTPSRANKRATAVGTATPFCSLTSKVNLNTLA